MKRTMRASLTGIAFLVTAVAFAGPASASTHSDWDDHGRKSASSVDNQFWKAVTDTNGSLRQVGKRDAVQLAKASCAALSKGAEPWRVLGVYKKAGFERRDSDVLVAGAVIYYCPSQQGKFHDPDDLLKAPPGSASDDD